MFSSKSGIAGISAVMEAAFVDIAVVEYRVSACVVRPFYFAESNDRFPKQVSQPPRSAASI